MTPTSIYSLIDREIFIPEYKNPVAYDEKHRLNYGYWICKKCENIFYAAGNPFHLKECPILDRKSYNQESLLYVLGPNESGFSSPYPQEKIRQIKQLAKKRLEQGEKKEV